MMIKELWNKKSFHRIFLNNIIEDLELKNKIIIDIGGGDKNSSYHYILKQKNNTFISVDISQKCDYKINLEYERLPFNDESQDIVFCFNVMEHIFNYQNLIDEMYRVLKKDGKLYFYVPFLVNKHADPNDFFRYTDIALKKIFEDYKFKEVKIKILSGSCKNIHSSISWLISNNKLFFIGRILNIFSGISMYICDYFLDKFSTTKKINSKYILGIYMEYEK